MLLSQGLSLADQARETDIGFMRKCLGGSWPCRDEELVAKANNGFIVGLR